PSRVPGSTAACTSTVNGCPANTLTPARWRRRGNSSTRARRPSSGSACTNPTSTRCGRPPMCPGWTRWGSGAALAPQRPKVESYDKTLFLVLKTVKYVERESVAKARQIVETGEIMIFVGADFVVTARPGAHGTLG